MNELPPFMQSIRTPSPKNIGGPLSISNEAGMNISLFLIELSEAFEPKLVS